MANLSSFMAFTVESWLIIRYGFEIDLEERSVVPEQMYAVDLVKLSISADPILHHEKGTALEPPDQTPRQMNSLSIHGLLTNRKVHQLCEFVKACHEKIHWNQMQYIWFSLQIFHNHKMIWMKENIYPSFLYTLQSVTKWGPKYRNYSPNST